MRIITVSRYSASYVPDEPRDEATESRRFLAMLAGFELNMTNQRTQKISGIYSARACGSHCQCARSRTKHYTVPGKLQYLLHDNQGSIMKLERR